MKKILFFASALAGLFFAASCQQENLEPVQQGNTVTYTVQLPDAIGTKAIGTNISTVTELIYEVYRIDENGDETCLYQMKEQMTNGSATVELELVNNQNFRVLFWAQVPQNGVYTTRSLKSVTLEQNLSANAENYAAFANQDVITYGDNLLGRKIQLVRPVAQLNIATSAESLKLGEDVDGNAQTTVSFETTGVVVEGLSTVYNVAEGAGVAANDGATFTYEAKPVALSENTINVNNVDYTYVSMNYVGFASKTGDNVKVSYTINTTNVGTITNTVENVPVKANYRTNIIGNLITSTSDYTVTLDNTWPEEETNVEVVSVSTAAGLKEAIDDIPAGTEGNIKLEGDINLSDLFPGLTRSATEESKKIDIPVGKEITLDLNGYSLTGVDEETASFGLINNRGNLTITNSSSNQSRIALYSVNDRDWNAYSSVISNNPGGNLLVKGNVLIEHIGGTDMAYGIDNLTNGKGTSAIATVEGATVKSTYRAIRQFLNGIEATNELYVKAGSKIYGPANKSIWMQDPSKNANTGKLVVEAGAELYGDVYLTVTAGSTEWPVEVSIADSALQDDYTVLTSNVPDKYELVNSNGVWTIDTSLIEEGDVITVYSANALKKIADKVNAGDTFEGKTVKLAADLDLKNEQWMPIGYWETFDGTFDGQNHTISNLKHHGTEADCYVGLFGYTNNATIKNLTINNVDIKLVANGDWAGGHIGALVGNADGTIVIENVNVTGNVKIEGDLTQAGAGRIGGVVGGNICTGTIKNVVVNANAGSFVKGNSSVGGIAGQLQPSATGGELTFENCSSNIDVTAQQFCAGGIIGLAAYGTSFTNCSTSGNISVLAGRSGNANDLYRVGGIAGGWDDGADKVLSLVNCFTTCELSGQSVDGKTATSFDCGGFVGRGYSTVVGAKVVVNGTEYIYAGDGKYADANGFVMIAPGLGKKEKTYAVSSAEGLVAMSNIAIKGGESVILTADIDLTGVEFNGLNAFNPESNNTFDGKGHTVSNWTYTGGAADMAFIKNWVGTINNVTIEGASLKTSGRSAVLAAKVYANIENCHVVDSRIEDSYWACGVIAGLYNSGSITNCSVDGCSVKSNGGVGGIVGVINESAGERKIENCSVKNTTVWNTGAYGEGYSAALVAGILNVEGATYIFNNCTLENNTKKGSFVGDLFYATEGNKVIVDGVQQ